MCHRKTVPISILQAAHQPSVPANRLSACGLNRRRRVSISRRIIASIRPEMQGKKSRDRSCLQTCKELDNVSITVTHKLFVTRGENQKYAEVVTIHIIRNTASYCLKWLSMRELKFRRPVYKPTLSVFPTSNGQREDGAIKCSWEDWKSASWNTIMETRSGRIHASVTHHTTTVPLLGVSVCWKRRFVNIVRQNRLPFPNEEEDGHPMRSPVAAAVVSAASADARTPPAAARRRRRSPLPVSSRGTTLHRASHARPAPYAVRLRTLARDGRSPRLVSYGATGSTPFDAPTSSRDPQLNNQGISLVHQRRLHF